MGIAETLGVKMGRIHAVAICLLLVACQPLPQGGGAARPSHSAIPSAEQSTQPSSVIPSPQASLHPIASPSSETGSNLLSENGITLRPLESLAEYWGVHLSAEEEEKYGRVYPSCMDQKGNFYFTGKSGLYQFSSSQRKITQVISTKLNPSVLIDGPPNTAEFTNFNQCIVFPDQSIYFLDRGYLRKLLPDRSVVTLNKTQEYHSTLRSMVFDPLNQRLICNAVCNGFMAWDLQTEKLIPLHQQYDPNKSCSGSLVDGELGKEARFGQQDIDLAIDSNSARLYVNDSENKAIRLIENNKVTTLAGGSKGAIQIDGQGRDAFFVYAVKIHYDSSRNWVYLLEGNHIRIVKLTGEVRTLNLPGQGNTEGNYFKNKYISQIHRLVMLDKNHWILFASTPSEEIGKTKEQVYAVTLPDTLPEIKI